MSMTEFAYKNMKNTNKSHIFLEFHFEYYIYIHFEKNADSH